jgi:hypothetical protein
MLATLGVLAGHIDTGTLMHMQGLPIVVVSQWLGHADPAFTMRADVHGQNDALQLAAKTLPRTPPRTPP